MMGGCWRTVRTTVRSCWNCRGEREAAWAHRSLTWSMGSNTSRCWVERASLSAGLVHQEKIWRRRRTPGCSCTRWTRSDVVAGFSPRFVRRTQTRAKARDYTEEFNETADSDCVAVLFFNHGAESVRTGNRPDARESGSGGLDDVAPHAQRLGLQPAQPDQSQQRRAIENGLVARDGTRSPGGNTPGLPRCDVSAEPGRLHRGDECRHGRVDLGLQARVA